jgi:tetratricopeptide (TPR) repeat protein
MQHDDGESPDSPGHDGAASIGTGGEGGFLASPAVSPYALERLLRAAYLQAGLLGDPGEVELRSDPTSLKQSRRESLRDNPEEQAQELAFQALECEDVDRAALLAGEALAHHTHCVDALVVTALVTAEDQDDLLAQLEHAARVAEDQHGDEFIAEFMGDLYTAVIARPYLRALRHLAEAQWDAGRRLDAIAAYENLLELDQLDHMDNSAALLACYLEIGEIYRARDVLDTFGDREDALFAWADALVTYLEGEHAEADAALARARELNGAAMGHLTGERESPALIEVWYESGSEVEAAAIGRTLGSAWCAHASALLWLLSSEDADYVGGADAFIEKAAAEGGESGFSGESGDSGGPAASPS